MTLDERKRAAARAALEFVKAGSIVGVGTGSTTNHFIDLLAVGRKRVEAAVASSAATAQRLERYGIPVIELGRTTGLELYVDGADEAARSGYLIKGGGGALTREKIVAAASRRFVCIVDDSKLVERLGAVPLPVEVIPMALEYVARELGRRGSDARPRKGFTTDNGNPILDVRRLAMDAPLELERELNQIAGVVSNGLFCGRPADVILVGGQRGVEAIRP